MRNVSALAPGTAFVFGAREPSETRRTSEFQRWAVRRYLEQRPSRFSRFRVRLTVTGLALLLVVVLVPGLRGRLGDRLWEACAVAGVTLYLLWSDLLHRRPTKRGPEHPA